jgi:zinc protease
MLDRSIAPPIIPVTDVAISEASSIELANGILCHYVNAGTQPVIKLELVFPAGSKETEQLTLAAFTAGMISEGTHTRTSADIANTVAFYGAELECNASSDRAILSLYALKKHLPALLPLVIDIITNASFPEEELVKQKRIRIQNLELQQQKTSYLATTAIGNVLYGEKHPYGRVASAAAFEAVTREQLLSFYQTHYQNFSAEKPLEIIASGLVDDEVLELLKTAFQNLASNNTSNSELHYVSSPSAEKQHLIVKACTQSTIRIAAPVVAQNHPDIFKLVFLKEALGGYFGSRLMKNIREDKGYTYGIFAQIIHGDLGSRLQIGTDVGIDVTQAALDEIYYEMQLLIDVPIPEEEMELIRGTMMGSLAGAVTNAFSLAECFKTIHFGHMDYAYFANLKQTIKTVTSQEIQAIAAKYLQRDHFYQVVAGGIA